MVAIVLADGEPGPAPTSIAPGRAGPRDRARRRRGRRRAPRQRLGLRSTRGSVTATRSARRARRAAATGVPVKLVAADKDESDTELAMRGRTGARADDLVILGALGGPRVDHALANVGLLALPGSAVATADPRGRLADRSLIRAPGRRLAGVERVAAGAAATTSRCCPWARASMASRRRPRYPLDDEPLAARSSAWPVECPVATRAPSSSGPAGSSWSSPCYALAMSMPARRSRRPKSPSPTSPAPSTAWPTSVAAGRSSTSTPRTTRPAAPSRRASSATQRDHPRARRGRVGGQPRAAASKRAFREKFGLPFTLLADADHAVAEAYGSWVEKKKYGKTYWGTARTTFLVDPDGRIARVWPKVKPEGHAADVLAVLDELQRRRHARSAGGFARGRASLDRRTPLPADAEHGEGRGRRTTLAPGPFHGHRRPPGRRRFRAGGDGRPLDRRRAPRAGSCAARAATRAARTRTPTRSSWPPSGRRSSGGRRDHRLRRRDLPPPARRRAGQRPGPARAARPRDPDLPPGRGPRDRSRHGLLPCGGMNHTDHRAAGMAAVDAVYPAARNPMAFPVAGARRAGGAPGPADLSLLVGSGGHLGRRGRVDGTQARGPAAHASQIHDAVGLETRIREWAAEEGGPMGAPPPKACGWFIDDDEDEGP